MQLVPIANDPEFEAVAPCPIANEWSPFAVVIDPVKLPRVSLPADPIA